MNTRWHEYRHNVPAARNLRTREIWAELGGRCLDEMKFRQQHPIGPFVVNFCCAEGRRVIELDGEAHEEQQEQDV